MAQADRLISLLNDRREHSTLEILDYVYGVKFRGIARISARIHELKKKGYQIEGKKDIFDSSIYWYRLVGVNSEPCSPAASVPQTVGAAPTSPSLKQPEMFAGFYNSQFRTEAGI